MAERAREVAASTITTDSPLFPLLTSFRFDPQGDAGLEETRTPGVFYHGSPNVNIRQFQSQRAGRQGVFFTQCPSLAAGTAIGKSSGGRVYPVRLLTQNPFYYGNWDEWATKIGSNTQAENAICEEKRQAGFDCIISLELDGTIFEAIALVDDIVKRLDEDIAPLRQWKFPEAILTLAFAPDECLFSPSYAPRSVILRRNEGELVTKNGAALINQVYAVYLDQALWELLDYDILQATRVGCLVCPRSGDALVMDPASIVPLTKAQSAQMGLSSQQKRQKRPKRSKRRYR